MTQATVHLSGIEEPITSPQPEYPDLLPKPLLVQQLKSFLSELSSRERALTTEINAIDTNRDVLAKLHFEVTQDIAALKSVLKRFPDELPSCEFDSN
jgi:hypothetical protein